MNKSKKMKELLKELDDVKKEYTSVYSKGLLDSSSKEFEQTLQHYLNKFNEIDREIRIIKKAILKDLPKDEVIYSLVDFINMCKNNNLTDQNGFGYYATIKSITNIMILPSDVKHNKIRNDFTHVVWFNK